MVPCLDHKRSQESVVEIILFIDLKASVISSNIVHEVCYVTDFEAVDSVINTQVLKTIILAPLRPILCYPGTFAEHPLF